MCETSPGSDRVRNDPLIRYLLDEPPAEGDAANTVAELDADLQE